MKLLRLSALESERFLSEHVRANTPALVSDAIDRWPSTSVGSVEFLARQFGDWQVQVYDDLFELLAVSSLNDYLNEFWERPPRAKPVPYVRWYAQFRELDFVWADEAFRALAPYWARPYFLPACGYLLPRCESGQQRDPVRDAFPGKGLFISAAGACTRSHCDPWCSDAVLCQLSGRKRFEMFTPQRAAAAQGPPDIQDVLEPGEVLFIPAGWPHRFETLTPSISLTWNFVHAAREAEFSAYLRQAMPPEERVVLEYFGVLPEHSSAALH